MTLDGADISARVIGVLSVKISAGQNRTASFTYDPPAGSIDPNDWAGKSVTIDIEDLTTTVRRVFTGVVDVPQFNISTRTVLMACTQNRNGLLSAYTESGIESLITDSRYSTYIFDGDADIPRKAEDRLLTVDKSLDFDGSNAAVLSDWGAKATADISLAATDVRNESVSVSLASRDSLRNSIAVNYKYRFTRLRHREYVFSWDYPGGNSAMATYIADPTTLAFRNQIIEAAQGTGLVLKPGYTFDDFGPSGYYGGISFVISPIEAAKYALGADFTLMQRFTQRVTEDYTVTVKAPQSITQFGEVTKSSTYGVTAEYDSSDWDDLDSYEDPSGTLSANGDYITDMTTGVDGDRTESDDAVKCGIAIARVQILGDHRANYVDLNTVNVRPDILIQHTIDLTSTKAQCKGKVEEIEHILHVGEDPGWEHYTRLKIALSRVENTAPTESAISAPTPPDTSDSGPLPSATILGSYFGNHAASPAYDETWDGLIGNYKYYDAVQTLNIYPEGGFIVRTPVVADADRNEREVSAASDHEIEIPNDTLVLN
ncbi:MAG: hypothetical protein OQK12_17295 [Motiliproteus sp.]|nr:hypothetical protein [Motiliproteus sp.]MCW9051228.1 hypothetical protein [Motiliproteus sp.]